MARPQTNKVDYFPHPVRHGKKMSYLEKKYKNDGYATWLKILEELGNTDFHYLDLSDDVQLMFLSDRCLVSEEVLINIINDLIRLKEFDKNLWEKHRILFNEKFVESIKDAYKKRSNNCIDKNSLLLLLDSLGILKLSKSNRKPNLSKNNTPVNPQSKVEYSKVKESRETRALDFLKNKYPSRYETDFLIKYAKNIQNKTKFRDDFNDTVDQEELEYTDKILFARLGKYARNWIENQNKYKTQSTSSNDVDRFYKNIPSG
ncbi:DUF4373 domain-containing protein [Mesonia sp. K4-1]|uniref:DUF4373 domain-containing protein n=1 Tax=Mesonia sp. K4-1 TaxID=2602760 RepID=UPI0011C78900|nr:DUF4373 domain-containing protein [Mesonia sp. K4-1]TXK78711.1 DUF4373 domain-containing protein [Mesonia sp. K4-1]